ncbi:MAG: hypothetical protein V7K50_24825 [Nostoc sp.]|uniref:hypothetical protein n=1 Tax=Nostoc sp. TaxID=1180 RepID=UPI002FF80D13
MNQQDFFKLRKNFQVHQLLLEKGIKEEFPSLREIDKLIENQLLSMSNLSNNNPIATKYRIDEALQILTQLGLDFTKELGLKPRASRNALK